MTIATERPTAAPTAIAARDEQHHPLIIRITHWLNALAMLIMIGSGWRIYNYHPALPSGFQFNPAYTLGGDYTTSEALHNEDGLANALYWHFGGLWLLVINILVYVGYGFLSGHFRRDFLPLRVGAFFRDLWAALRFKLDHRLGEYNAVQKAFYWGVLGAILLVILSGLSIWKPVQLQELVWVFGGYEDARVVHFFAMCAIVAFVVVHVALTILVPKTFVAMVTGHATGAPHRSRSEARP